MKLSPKLRPLIEKHHWCIWRYETLPNKERPTKVPYQSKRPNHKALSSNPATWSSYADAVKAARAVDVDGIGFNLLDSGIGALDLDDCRDPDTGDLVDWAARMIADAGDAYCEITPSGRGFRIIGLAKGEQAHTMRRMSPGKVEIYRSCERYITITGEEYKK